MSDSLKEVVTSLKPDKSSLLPCPFCGGEADEYEGDYGNGIYCMMCGAMVGEPIHLEYRTTKRVSIAEAIAAWNTRADDYRQAADYWQRMYEEAFAERTCENVGYYIDGTRFKCSECGYNGWTKWAKDGEDRIPNYCPSCGAKVIGG